MKEEKEQVINKPHENPYKIVTEDLGDASSDLKSFFFNHGGNFYVFSYEKEGMRRHTFIDTGDFLYHNRILDILKDNNIEPGNIERIIITHHHSDHCGLADVLAGESGAKILVQANFRNVVEGRISEERRQMLGSLDLSHLRRYNMVYLAPSGERGSISLAGLNFPRLTEPIKIGNYGRIDILTCPESATTHSLDQIIVLYSPRTRPYTLERGDDGFRLTDEIIFPGDLWLMHGPLFTKGFRQIYRRLRFAYHQLKGPSAKEGIRLRDPREQDAEAKFALKIGFCLIRVKPGHGEEFLGARIIPKGLLAQRDMLLILGYGMNESKSTLKTDSLAQRVPDLLEKARLSFEKELLLWMEQGYDAREISDLLIRIYKEQEGGGPLVEEDRRERRKRLTQTLDRLKDGKTGADCLRQIAEATLSKLSV